MFKEIKFKRGVRRKVVIVMIILELEKLVNVDVFSILWNVSLYMGNKI